MKPNASSATPLSWLGLVQKNVESIRFGVVQLVVHEGKVVQIDRTEKIRVEQLEPKRTASPALLS